MAQGALLAGTMANKIFYADATLSEFKVELIGIVAVMVFTVLGPMLAFSARLESVKRERSARIRHAGAALRARLRPVAPRRGAADEPLVGSADIQSLADLANGFEVVKDMRWVPFTLPTVLQLAVTTLAPVLPLMLTMISLEELLERLAADADA